MIKLLAALLLALGMSAQAQVTFYDTFNEADQNNIFDCCNTWQVSARKSEDVHTSIGMQFTSLASGQVNNLSLALSQVSPAGVLLAQIRLDENGLPGKALRWFHFYSVPQGGQCCIYQSDNIRHFDKWVPLTAGTTYWVTVTARGEEVGGWNYNSLGLSGTMATSQGGVWQVSQGTIAAFRLSGIE
jgi:hypothetical protein